MEACDEGHRRMEEEDRGGQGSTTGCSAIVEEEEDDVSTSRSREYPLKVFQKKKSTA